jgi:hypothetical protein
VVLLAPLATPADLDDRNITVPDGMFAPAILASASTAVRDAAGCPISQTTSTVTLTADDRCGIDLPGVPVTAVASVAVEGVTVAASTLTNGCWSDGWRLSGNSILFRGQTFETPATVTVTYTHGLAVVPADIIDLVCGVAAVAFSQDGDYGNAGRLQSVRLGDFAESYNPAAGAGSPSPTAIPKTVRDSLRARFGTSAATLRMR